MAVPFPDQVLGTDDVRPWDNELSLRNIWVAVRRWWWAGALAFLAVVALGAWRTRNERPQFQAAASVRVSQQQAPIAGVPMAQPIVDYRVDRLLAETEVIKSGVIAERVARRLGIQLSVVDPEDVTRTMITGEIPVITPDAAEGQYRLDFTPVSYSLSRGGAVLGSAAYGDTLHAPGIALSVPSRPGVGDHPVILAILSPGTAAAIVRGSVDAQIRERTDIIDIKVTMPDRLLAAQVANAIATEYAEFSKETMREQAAAKTAFIGTQLEDQRTQVGAAENALRAFRKRHGLTTDVAAEQGSLAERVYAREIQREGARLEESMHQALVGELTAHDTTTEKIRLLIATPAVANNASIKGLYDRWFTYTTEQQNVLATERYNHDYHVVRALDTLIATTKRDLIAATGVYVRELRSRIAAYTANIDSLRSQMDRYPGLAADQAQLMAVQETRQQVYDHLQEQYQLARIAQAVDVDVVRQIAFASMPIRPISPDWRRDLMLAVVVGLLLAIGVAVVLDRLDDSVRSPDEIAGAVGLPILGLIPTIKLEHGSQPSEPVIMERLITHASPRSPVAEAYRSLRTNLAFTRAGEEMKTFVLTSPGPADGKSTTVANLAITFAQQGQRTLLIDADLRRAVLDKTFAVPRSPGLTEVIVGDAELEHSVNATHVPNLFVLGSGQFPPNPSELLGSRAMREVLRGAAEQFDVVLLDSPPLLAVTDAAVLSTIAQGTILVVRMGATARQAVRRAFGQLQAVHARVTGVVVNDVDLKRSSYYGGYGYYYYSYYGSETNGNGHRSGVLNRLRRITAGARPGVG
jgi:tyrosine-protein kinase Etk/Wzc